jgi:hypothetical protein
MRLKVSSRVAKANCQGRHPCHDSQSLRFTNFKIDKSFENSINSGLAKPLQKTEQITLFSHEATSGGKTSLEHVRMRTDPPALRGRGRWWQRHLPGQRSQHPKFEAVNRRLSAKISRILRDFHARFVDLTPKTHE